jgi:hypothetical protein
MTEKVTFQESAATDDKQPARLQSVRDRLGSLGFTITLVTVVIACLALGAAVSILVKMVN